LDFLTAPAIADAELPGLYALMKPYEDRAMAFADATLVHPGTGEGLGAILTLDHADSETCRLPYGEKFRMLPQRKN
jgi:hypothetical protein